MTRRALEEEKQNALRSWMENSDQKKIAEESGRSEGWVSKVINEKREAYPELGDLKKLNLELKAMGETATGIKPFVDSKKQLTKDGISDVDTVFLSNFLKKHSGDPSKVVQSAARITQLEQETGKSYISILADFEEKRGMIEQSKERIKQLEKREADLKNTIAQAEKLKPQLDQLQRHNITEEVSLESFFEFYDEMEKLDFTRISIKTFARELIKQNLPPEEAARILSESISSYGSLKEANRILKTTQRTISTNVQSLSDEETRLKNLIQILHQQFAMLQQRYEKESEGQKQLLETEHRGKKRILEEEFEKNRSQKQIELTSITHAKEREQTQLYDVRQQTAKLADYVAATGAFIAVLSDAERVPPELVSLLVKSLNDSIDEEKDNLHSLSKSDLDYARRLITDILIKFVRDDIIAKPDYQLMANERDSLAKELKEARQTTSRSGQESLASNSEISQLKYKIQIMETSVGVLASVLFSGRPGQVVISCKCKYCGSSNPIRSDKMISSLIESKYFPIQCEDCKRVFPLTVEDLFKEIVAHEGSPWETIARIKR